MSDSRRSVVDFAGIEYVMVGVVFTVLVVLWFVIQYLVKAVFEAGQFVIYIVAALSFSVSAYSALVSTRLKRAELRHAREGAEGTVSTNVVDALSHICDYKTQGEEITKYPDWEEMILDLQVVERRTEERLARAAVLASQFAPDVFAEVHDLYLEILRAFMRVERFRLDTSSNLRKDEIEDRFIETKDLFVKHLESAAKKIREKYSEVGPKIGGLAQSLPCYASSQRASHLTD